MSRNSTVPLKKKEWTCGTGGLGPFHESWEWMGGSNEVHSRVGLRCSKPARGNFYEQDDRYSDCLKTTCYQRAFYSPSSRTALQEAKE